VVLVVAAALLPLAACSRAATDDLSACGSAATAADAISICTRVIESGATSKHDQAIGYMYRGLAYQGMGDRARSMRDLDAAVKAAPSDSMIIANRGAALSQQGDLDAGWRDLEAALRLDPNNVLALGNRGIIREKRGEFVAARADIDRAIEIDPRPYQPWAERCWIGGVLADQLPKTITDCDQAIKLESRDPNNYNSRAFVHFRMGDFQAAIADYDKSIEGNPKVGSSFFMRGLAKRAAGDLAGGDADIAKGKQMEPDVADRYAGYGVKAQ
jgi:tetratricopeptide (TPR) repeat protein